MRAAIFDPYLDSLGGGERYTGAVAKVLLSSHWQVDLLWADRGIIKALKDRFSINLQGANVVPDFFIKSLSEKFLKSREYDLIFYVSDGSIPTLGARKNWLHLQVPFHRVNGRSLKNRLKFKLINRVVVNSQFTKNVIDREFGIKSQVVYPPVDTISFKPLPKTKSILYVGRFSKLLQDKHQDILISTFKELVDGGLRGWKLILAGGTQVGFTETDTEQLKKSVSGYPIELSFNPDFKLLVSYFGRSSFFWAAGGYGEDPVAYPERMEHFGITVVEAMASKSIPLAVDLGGYPEILTDDLSGLLWEKTDDLKVKTLELIKNAKKTAQLREKVWVRALDFSEEKFTIIMKGFIDDDFSQ